MKHIVFHVGAHKSATSSVQLALADAVKGDTATQYIMSRHPSPILDELCHYTWGQRDPGDLNAFMERLCEFLRGQPASRIILSQENMLGGMPGLSWSFYPGAHLLRRILDRVAEEFSLSVALQSRETSSYLRSCHRFRVTRGMTLEFDRFLEALETDTFSWQRLASTLFGHADFKYRVLPIEHFEREDGPEQLQSFAEFLLPSWNLDRFPIEKVNPSPCDLTMATIFELSRAGIGIPPEKLRLLDEQLRQIEGHVTCRTKAEEQLSRSLEGVGAESPKRLGAEIFAAASRRAASGLDRLPPALESRFSADYASFCADYAPPMRSQGAGQSTGNDPEARQATGPSVTEDLGSGPGRDGDNYVEHMGVKIAVPADISDTVMHFMRQGRYETREARTLDQVMEPGERVLELGGGLGFISTIAALHRNCTAVLTYEANPALREIILKTHRMNGVVGAEVRTGVLLRQARTAFVPFYARRDFWGSSLSPRAGETGARKIDVPVHELARVLAEYRPTMIVCDIEGGEVDLFDGSSLEPVRKILIELHQPVIGANGVKAVFDALSASGFHYDQELSSGGVVLFRRLDGRNLPGRAP